MLRTYLPQTKSLCGYHFDSLGIFGLGMKLFLSVTSIHAVDIEKVEIMNSVYARPYVKHVIS